MATADAVGVESTGLSGSLSGISTRGGQMNVVAKSFHEPVDRDFMTRNAVLAPYTFARFFCGLCPRSLILLIGTLSSQDGNAKEDFD